MSGNMDTVRQVVKSFSAHEPNLNFEIHNISNALKHYLRSLDPPLIPYEFFVPLLDAYKNEDAETIRNICWRIPNDNRLVLTRLVSLLVKISERYEINRMDAKNLSIVFGPTVLKPRTPTLDRMALMSETQTLCGIMQMLIEDFEYIFSDVAPQGPPKSFTNPGSTSSDVVVVALDNSNNSINNNTASTSINPTSPSRLTINITT
ncbi:hypothetical protein SAMD00019534_093420, partial [Acytostelium subglobosum LB1]|uniref:hypothetical protein n=1 Tax=Acytostelium subglobosum LB1 TaxID=1410327 RepID=UPI000644E1D2